MAKWAGAASATACPVIPVPSPGRRGGGAAGRLAPSVVLRGDRIGFEVNRWNTLSQVCRPGEGGVPGEVL